MRRDTWAERAKRYAASDGPKVTVCTECGDQMWAPMDAERKDKPPVCAYCSGALKR